MVDLLDIDIGFVDDGDALAGAVHAGLVERVQVILYGEVRRGHRKVSRVGIGPLRRCLMCLRLIACLSENANVTLDREVVERDKSADDRRQRRRNLRFAGVGVMRLAVDLVLVNLGVESLAQLGNVAGELDGLLAGVDFDDVEAMAAEPGLNGRDVLIGRAELLAELLGRQPFVVIGGAWSMQIADELSKGGFLAVAALEDEMHAFKRHAFGRGSAIIGWIRQRMHSAFEGDKPAFIDRIDDSRGGSQFLGHRC